MKADTAYIAGLMHTIGQLPIYMVFPKAGADIAFDLESKQEAQYMAETLNEDVAATLGLDDAVALAGRIETYRVFVDEAKAYL
jgi:HD-like signal output (HDOD) protein